MPRFSNQMRLIRLEDFSGGLNTKDSPGAIADNQLSENKNCYLIGKDVAKRKGYTQYNNGSRIDIDNAGAGITQYPYVGGQQIIAVAGTKIGKKGTNTWTNITGSVTLTKDNKSMFTVINNELVSVNGTDPAWYYNGTGNAQTLSGTNIPTAPVACESFHGRLFLSSGRSLLWSDYMGNWKNDFPNDNEQSFPEAITGLRILGDVNSSVLLIFTVNQIHSCAFDPTISDAVGGSGTFTFDHITNQHGCISPYSVQECVTDDGTILVIWADRDGLKAITPEYKVVKLTENIQPTWDKLSIGDLTKAIGVFYKPKRWYLLYCRNLGSTYNDKVIVYDLRNWCVAGIFDWSCSAVGIVQESSIDILVGSDYDGYWNRYDYGENDNGVAIDAYINTKIYDGGTPTHDKGFRSITMEYAFLGQNTISVTAVFEHLGATESILHTVYDGTLDRFILDKDKLGVNEQLTIARETLAGRGRTIQLKIANNGIDQPFRIHKTYVTYQIGKMM